MDSGTAGVDNVEVVGGEIGRFDAESAGEIVATCCVGTLGLSDGYSVFSVILIVGSIAIDGEFSGKNWNSNLFIVGSWLNEDNRSRGGGC